MAWIRRPNIGWGALFLLVLLFTAYTLFVAAIVLHSFRVTEFVALELFGFEIPDILYVVGVGFLGFLVQHRLSDAYGARRAIDFLVSAPVWVVLAGTALLWLGFPVVAKAMMWISTQVGLPFESSPDEYKVGAFIVFAFFALIDVFRDMFGVGRRSQAVRAGVAPDIRDRPREASAAHAQPASGASEREGRTSPAAVSPAPASQAAGSSLATVLLISLAIAIAGIAIGYGLMNQSVRSASNPVPPPAPDRTQSLATSSSFQDWREECAAAGREVYTTAEFDAKFPHLAKRRDDAPWHCYRPAKVGRVRSLLGE